jgi:hypothetical protein
MVALCDFIGRPNRVRRVKAHVAALDHEAALIEEGQWPELGLFAGFLGSEQVGGVPRDLRRRLERRLAQAHRRADVASFDTANGWSLLVEASARPLPNPYVAGMLGLLGFTVDPEGTYSRANPEGGDLPQTTLAFDGKYLEMELFIGGPERRFAGSWPAAKLAVERLSKRRAPVEAQKLGELAGAGLRSRGESLTLDALKAQALYFLAAVPGVRRPRQLLDLALAEDLSGEFYGGALLALHEHTQASLAILRELASLGIKEVRWNKARLLVAQHIGDLENSLKADAAPVEVVDTKQERKRAEDETSIADVIAFIDGWPRLLRTRGGSERWRPAFARALDEFLDAPELRARLMAASRTPHIWDLLQGLLADEDVWLYDSRWRKRRKRFAHRTGLYASDTPAYRAFRVGVADDAVDVWSATIAGLFGQEHVGRVPGATAVFAEVLRLDQHLVPTSSAMVKGAWRLFFRGRPVATERAPESFHEAFRDFTRLWHLLFALVDEVGVLRRSDAGRAWLSPAGRTLNSSIPYWYALVARENELAGPRLDALVGESLNELIGAAKVQLSKRMKRPLAERVLDALAAKHGATAQVLARTMPDSPETVAAELERQVSLGKLSRRGDANVSWPRYFFAYDTRTAEGRAALEERVLAFLELRAPANANQIHDQVGGTLVQVKGALGRLVERNALDFKRGRYRRMEETKEQQKGTKR